MAPPPQEYGTPRCEAPRAITYSMACGPLTRPPGTADAGLPNFRHYLAAGAYHTLLRDDNYYDEASAGVPFAGWLGQMLANQGGTGGRGGKWFDAACPGCLTPLPCE